MSEVERIVKFRCPVSLRIALAIFVVMTLAGAAFAQAGADTSDPTTLQPTGFVNDYVGVIDAATKAELEKKLTDLKTSTNPQVEIAVVVVKTTGGRDIFDYSLTLARTWKIGSKADDNPSALLLVAIDDRKYFTQISRDLEDELPDGLVGSLQRRYLVPEFKQGNYAKGISDTVDAYIARIREKGNVAGVPNATPSAGYDDSASGIGGTACCCIAGILIAFILLSLYLNHRSGGGRGGGGSSVVDSALPWVVGGILNGIINSSGSSSDSGWGGGGGSDWGGFGGGGDFGGGGAGGDW